MLSQEAERHISDQKEQLELITLEKQQLEAEKHESVKAKTQVELIIKDLEDIAGRNETEREALQADLAELEEQIIIKEQELEAIEPRFREVQAQEASVKAQIEQAEAKQQSLLAKQGRASQFRTQAERDKYLKAQIRNSTATLEGQQKALEGVADEIQSTKHVLDERKKLEAELRETLEVRREEAKKYTLELNDLNAKRAELVEQRKEVWKEDEKLQQTVSHASAELKKAENVLRTMMDRVSSLSLKSRVQLNDIRLDE